MYLFCDIHFLSLSSVGLPSIRWWEETAHSTLPNTSKPDANETTIPTHRDLSGHTRNPLADPCSYPSLHYDLWVLTLTQRVWSLHTTLYSLLCLHSGKNSSCGGSTNNRWGLVWFGNFVSAVTLCYFVSHLNLSDVWNNATAPKYRLERLNSRGLGNQKTLKNTGNISSIWY